VRVWRTLGCILEERRAHKCWSKTSSAWRAQASIEGASKVMGALVVGSIHGREVHLS
jgi:hypothetical protein